MDLTEIENLSIKDIENIYDEILEFSNTAKMSVILGVKCANGYYKTGYWYECDEVGNVVGGCWSCNGTLERQICGNQSSTTCCRSL